MVQVLDPFPIDPLTEVITTPEYRRSVINGILESYNGNYDFLIEATQNAVDALEDASFLELPPPYLLEVTINLKENWISILDTGVGLTAGEVIEAFRPHVTLKVSSDLRNRRGALHSYRGYKGVGLTFLAYGTDEIRFHTKRDDQLVKAKMEYGLAWAQGRREEPAHIDIDAEESPLERHARGTYIRVHFSSHTRPRSLVHLASQAAAWPAIVRTRTAAGQVLLGRDPVIPLALNVQVVSTGGEAQNFKVAPEFLYPHTVDRQPPYRFLDLNEYFRTFPEQVDPPLERSRQDGLHLEWDTGKIRDELIEGEREAFANELSRYRPYLYAFVPYQGSVWAEMNEVLTGNRARNHLYPGLMLAVNRQRLADIFDIQPTRYETFGHNVFVIVHFDEARPDQGRKTVQDEVLGLAKAAGNRVVQYLGKRRSLLKPPGESPTPQQRQVERNHQDWQFNVLRHAEGNPLHLPPLGYVSVPLTEQDVIGLFHQLCALGTFPGIRIYATSQMQTYDCLVRFECTADTPGLRYVSLDNHPLGLSPFVIGDADRFETPNLTLEFKNNLDGLISDLEDPDNPKSYRHVHACVCWASVSDRFAGYELTELTESNLDQRVMPGATHVLRRDGEGHSIQVIMLERIVDLVRAGQLGLQGVPAEAL